MTNLLPSIDERLLIRERPACAPIMYQSWDKLLFMRWQMPVQTLRAFIPDRLRIDTFQGQAWVALTPFTVIGARPIFLPPLPWISAFYERRE